MVFTGLSIAPIDFYEGDIFGIKRETNGMQVLYHSYQKCCFVLMPHGDSLEGVLRDCINFYVGNVFSNPERMEMY